MIASRVASVLLVVAQALFRVAVVLWLPVAILATLFWGWGIDLSGALGSRVFLSAAWFLMPGLAALGYNDGTGWMRFAKAIALSGIGVASMTIAAAIAIAQYPQYPKQGPHEWLAAATILPAVALPAGVMAWWKRLGMSARSWKLYFAWSVLVLGGTIALFGRKVETALPLSVASVNRWERSDIQDFSNYFIRAEGIELKEAERYAARLGLIKSEGTFGCGSEDEAEFTTEGEWQVPDHVKVWGRDDRVQEGNTDKFPSGMSGCFTRAAWGSQTLLVCKICSWGI